jgi:hypothetical protein
VLQTRFTEKCKAGHYLYIKEPDTPASSTTKTGIAEILLKVALNTKNQIKSKQSETVPLQGKETQHNMYVYFKQM